MADEPLGQPVPLAEPRPPTGVEAAVLDLLVRGPGGTPALVAQTACAEVSATCGCGCPSVCLRTSAPADTTLGPDPVELVASGTNADGERVEAILHVVGGLVVELELWAGRSGPTGLPALAALRHDSP